MVMIQGVLLLNATAIKEVLVVLVHVLVIAAEEMIDDVVEVVHVLGHVHEVEEDRPEIA